MINIWNFLKAFSSVTTCSWYIYWHLHMFFGTFSSPHLCLEGWLQGWLVSANQQMAGISWLALQDIWEYCPTPFYQSFAKNYPFDENNENKLNKHGLLLNPIVIGTRLCRTSMGSLKKVSGHLYMANHVFLACRVPWVSPMATGITINH